MKIVDAEKILKDSKNEDDLIANIACVSHALTKDGAKMGLKILKRTGLLTKIQEISKESDGLEVLNDRNGPVIKRGDAIIAPLNVMPISYYMDNTLGLKGARFYRVYRCLLDSPEIVAALALSDSVKGR